MLFKLQVLITGDGQLHLQDMTARSYHKREIPRGKATTWNVLHRIIFFIS